ncbi:YSIRK-targeted surface antigen transcriptional regulator [Streptococcus penaeicida]|uniref:YSIRK-targeted surface antigen transcriptional regulator n=1 Tax=Streptococcus penaeicida TaxID=1765960 RepID=UPI001FE8A97E|nr:YSIRK-targeted surface antigen transcriptional regulator [Streptococcus penaeicida]
MYQHPLLESLHTCLRIPIFVLNSEYQLIRCFHLVSDISLRPQLLAQLAVISNRKSLIPFSLLKTPSNQVLALYPLQNELFLFGPFQVTKSQIPEQGLAEVYAVDEGCFESLSDQETAISLDLPHFLHLIHYFFTQQMHFLKKDQRQLTNQILSEIRQELSENLIQQCHLKDKEAFDFEFQLLESVKRGKLEEVKKYLAQDLTPASYHKDLRSEKNYSIILFEKLSQLAIKTGVDHTYAHHTRDYYIGKCEKCQKASEVLLLRESAIILFTQKIGHFNHYSYLVSNILRYINANLSKKILIESIAKEFHFSESNIRKLFRKEMSCSIQQYIRRKKMEEAKIMLRNQNSVTDISNSLATPTWPTSPAPSNQ